MTVAEEWEEAMRILWDRTYHDIMITNNMIKSIRRRDRRRLREWETKFGKYEATPIAQPKGPSFTNPCYRCGGKDHHEKRCSRQAYCFECGDYNHIRSTCPWRVQQKQAEWKIDCTLVQREKLRKWCRALNKRDGRESTWGQKSAPKRKSASGI